MFVGWSFDCWTLADYTKRKVLNIIVFSKNQLEGEVKEEAEMVQACNCTRVPHCFFHK